MCKEIQVNIKWENGFNKYTEHNLLKRKYSTITSYVLCLF